MRNAHAVPIARLALLVSLLYLVAAGAAASTSSSPRRAPLALVDGPAPWTDLGAISLEPRAGGEAGGLAVASPADRRAGPEGAVPRAPGSGADEGEAAPARRLDWYWRQRAYPLDIIPVDANLRAAERARSMAAALSPAETWTSLGPAPIEQGLIGISGCVGDDCDTWRTTVSGRTKAIAFQPGNPDVMYLGTATGGVWKTTDGGASFKPLTDNQPVWSIFSLAVDPAHPSVVYAGTGEISGYYGVGLLKSSDGGQTWTLSGQSEFAGMVVSAIAIRPGSSNVVTVATAHPVDKVGQASALPGVFRSTDGGASWASLLQCKSLCYGFTDLVVDDTNPQVMYAALGGGGIFKTTDGGDNWTLLTGGFPERGFSRIKLAIGHGAGSATLYAGLAARVSAGGQLTPWGLVYRSTDGGATWHQISNAPNYCSTQCLYDNAVAVDPRDADVVYVGGNLHSEDARWGGVVYRSTDGGDTWQDTTPGTALNQMVHPDMHVIALDPRNPDVVWIGNDGGLFRSPDAGRTWQSANANLATLQFIHLGVHPTNPNLAVGGLQDNAKARYDGTRWTGLDSGDGGYSAIDPFDPTIWYSTRYSIQGTIIQFQRNMQSGTAPLGDWPQSVEGLDVNDRVQFYVPFELDPAQPGVIYLGTQRLYRTSDRGDHWAAISGDLTKGADTDGSITAIGVAADRNTLYVGTSDGKVQVTSNRGQTWADVTRAPLPNRWVSDFAVDRAAPRTVYAAFNGYDSHTAGSPGHVFKTTDGGQSWQNVSGNLPDIPVLSIVQDPVVPANLYVGTDIGVFRSTNGGASWAAFNAGMATVPVYDLELQASTRLLWAATHGRGVFRTRLTEGSGATPTPGGRISRVFLPVVARGYAFRAPPPTPQAGPLAGAWAGDSAAFDLGNDQVSLWSLRVKAAVPGCETWVAYPGFVRVAGGAFEADVDLRENGAWQTTGRFTSQTTAAGTATFQNMNFGTSCGTWSGTVSWTATWQSPQAGPTPTPTPRPTAAGPTPTPQSTAGIHGQVRYAGQGIAGLNLLLIRCPVEGPCDEIASKVASAVTGPGGYYNFAGVPDLPANETYQVFYFNDPEADNLPDDHYLWRWYGPPIAAYSAGGSADGGSFDVDDIRLLEPHDPAVSLPATFAWQGRAVPGEQYRWALFDLDSGDTVCAAGPAPATSLTLTESDFEGTCGGQYGVTYGWYVWAVAGGDWNQGHGDSYYYSEITFEAAGGETPTPTPTATRVPATATPTPTPPPSGSGSIFGRVTFQGSGQAGIVLELLRCQGTTSCTTARTTTTGAGGAYAFANPAGLPTGESYQVRFVNAPSNGNPAVDEYLAHWSSFYIPDYAAGSQVAGGDFDIADAPLVLPLDDASETLPAVFVWLGRDVAGDHFSWMIADADGKELCWVNPPVTDTSFVLDVATAAECGLSYNTPYRWYVYVTAGDNWDNGYGANHFYRVVTITPSTVLRKSHILGQPAPRIRRGGPGVARPGDAAGQRMEH